MDVDEDDRTQKLFWCNRKVRSGAEFEYFLVRVAMCPETVSAYDLALLNSFDRLEIVFDPVPQALFLLAFSYFFSYFCRHFLGQRPYYGADLQANSYGTRLQYTVRRLISNLLRLPQLRVLPLPLRSSLPRYRHLDTFAV